LPAPPTVAIKAPRENPVRVLFASDEMVDQLGLDIQRAGQGDIPALLRLYRHLNPGDPPLALPEAERILEAFGLYPGSAIFLGRLDREPVTTCSLVVIPNLTRGGAPVGLIENVVTAATHRQRGHGRAIISAALAAAWDRGCYKVMLLTGSTNPATLKFYEDLGFEQTKTGYQIRRLARRQE
jgi:GNAT superfamily N-acetyltransferase